MSVKLGRSCWVGIWIEGVQNMDTKTHLDLGGRNKVKLRNSSEGHPENKDRFAMKKNKIKINLNYHYHGLQVTFLHGRLWRVFACLRHRPPPPVLLTNPWRHPSLLHRLWSVCHPKNPFSVGNKWKSLRTESGLYAGCSKTSQQNSWSIAFVLAEACGSANRSL